VDQECVVDVAARRADVDHDLRGVDPGDALHRVAELLVGCDARFGLVELPLFRYADGAFDLDAADAGAVFDLDFRFHVSGFVRVGNS